MTEMHYQNILQYMKTQNDKKINKYCDRASCTSNIHNFKTTKDNVSHPLCSKVKLISKKQNFKNSLSCGKVPLLSKTPSGNMVIVIDDQANEITDKKTKYNDCSASLKRSGNKVKVNVQKRQNDRKIVLNKHTSPGNLNTEVMNNKLLSKSKILPTSKNKDMLQGEIAKRLLEIFRHVKDKKNKKTLQSSPSRLSDIEFEHETLENFDGAFNTTSFGNVVIDMEDIQRPEKLSKSYTENSKTKSFPRDKYFKVKLKGSVCPYFTNSSIVLKSTDEKNYELVFDKEFENILKDVIKDVDGDDKDHFVHMYKGDYDQYVLDLEGDKKADNFSEDAILVKSPSGRIVILSNEMLKSDSYDNACKRKSIIKPDSLVNILKELVPCNSRPSKTQHEKPSSSKNTGTASKLVAFNLIRKAQINSETRIDCQNVQEMLQSGTPAIIHKSDSGRIEIVLQKNFNVDRVDKLKKYLTDNKNNCETLETLKFGIHLDPTLYNNEKSRIQKTISSELTKSLSNEDIFVDGKILNKKSFTKKLISQANSTTCSCHSYDSNKCVLQNKRNNWIGVPEKNNYIQTMQSHSNDLDKKLTDIASYSNKDCYSGEQVCPLHIKRNYGEVNAQGISGFCSNHKNEIINKTSGFVKKFKTGDMFRQDQKEGTYWDFIENLPPQLPPFLRDYTYD